MNTKLLQIILCLSLIFTIPATSFGFSPMAAGGASGDGGNAGSMMGIGRMGDDLVLDFTAQFEFSVGKFGVGLGIPLHIILDSKNKEAKDEAYYGLIRKEDWDETSDYLRVIKFLRYGQKREPIYFRIGELRNAYIGHGTIMSGYFNGLLIDHYRAGLQFDLNSDYAGVETITDNLMDPNIVGGRVYVHPFSVLNKDSYLNNLAVGVSIITDIKAPFSYKKDGSGQVMMADKHPVVDKSKQLEVVGLDAEFTVIDSKLLRLIPYADFNKILNHGQGMHLGFLTIFHFDLGVTLDLQTRWEYRMFGEGYMPIYFDTFYDVQKYDMPLSTAVAGGGPTPKIKALADSGIIHGYYGDLSFNFIDAINIGGTYEDYQGDNNSRLLLFLVLPKMANIELKGEYRRTNFEGISEAFARDERSALIAYARYYPYSYIYFGATYLRSWQFDEKNKKYEATDSYSTGFGLNFDF